ncbi:MAG: oligosaccharide repeat unit polymerase [Bacteroidetes bacterium]|nr:oligosaccharide repeat unit polymerase [Bacteroidota bacterium]
MITPYIKFSVPYVTASLKHKEFILICISLLLLVPIIATFKLNINLNTLLLSEIYETRDAFSENLTGYLSYLYHFEVKTIIPIALVFFMINKKPLFIGLFVIILLYLFVISGNKAVYFTTILVVYFYYIGKDYVSKISNFFSITVILFILFPLIDLFVFKSPFLGGTFVNRFLFIPALLTHWYFDFFDGNPFYFAESSFFNLFVSSPYDTPIGFHITKIYWGDSEAYANNGIVSDGFMNLGYLGVLLFSVIFSLLFSLFNSFNLHTAYFGVFFSYIYIFLSAPLLTSFITGGILPFILISFTILNNRKII